MGSVAPNQKEAIIHKVPKSGVYARTDKEAQKNASRRMNGKKDAGFHLWVILDSNMDGHHFKHLSNKFFLDEYGIKKDSYDAGIKILIEQGFLVRNNGNLYDFYEYPDEHKSGSFPLLESGESQQLNVGLSHNEKQDFPTFKCGTSPQDNIIEDNYDTTTNTTGDGDGGSNEVGNEERKRKDLTIIQRAAAEAGFQDSQAVSKRLISLYENYGKETVLEGIGACVDHDKVTIAYLVGCCNRIRSGGIGHDDPLIPRDHEYYGLA